MSPPAGRPREFDEAKVLDEALQVFWAYGYEATSVADLLAATGLQKGSLYAAFGDKRSLFLRTLKHYLRVGRTTVQSVFASSAPVHEQLFQIIAGPCEAGNQRRGCFAVNCLIELAPHDADVNRLIAPHFRQIEALLSEHLRARMACGEVREGPPEQLAGVIMTFMMGVAAASRGSTSSVGSGELITRALERLL